MMDREAVHHDMWKEAQRSAETIVKIGGGCQLQGKILLRGHLGSPLGSNQGELGTDYPAEGVTLEKLQVHFST